MDRTHYAPCSMHFLQVTRASYILHRFILRSVELHCLRSESSIRVECVRKHVLPRVVDMYTNIEGGRGGGGGRSVYISAFPLDALTKVRMHFYKPPQADIASLIRISLYVIFAINMKK